MGVTRSHRLEDMKAAMDGSDDLSENFDQLSMGSEQKFVPDADDDQESSVSLKTASSIIGGSAVAHGEPEGEQSASDDEQYEINHTGQEITSEDLDNKSFKNEHKVFNFSLPFGGNPLSHLPSIKNLKGSLPIIGNNDADDYPLDAMLTREEIKNKLKRQISVSTEEEAYLYKNSHGIDSSRFRAMKRALTPSVNLSLPGEEKKKLESSVWDDIEGEVVILGGYRGSILRDRKTNKRVWIPFRAGFNIRKINLLIGPTDEDEAKAQEEIYSDDMMTHVGPVDISRKLKAKLTNGKTKVHTFGYDWRLSSDISSEQLYEFLKGLDCNKPGSDGKRKGAIVIAHSMGGLIAHHAMQKDPSLFRGLIYVGVPAMCPNILGPIRFGDSVLFSSKILTAEANFFMRSSFVFLPQDGRCFVDRKTHKHYNLDYFDPQSWVDYNLSPLVGRDRKKEEETKATKDDQNVRPRTPMSPIFEISEMKRSLSLSRSEPETYQTSFEDSFEYLKRTLKRTRKFLDELAYDETKNYPPLAIVYGNEVPTVRGCRVDGPQGIVEGDYDDFYYGPGDGVVHHKWLMPERRDFPVVAKLASPLGHISLMTDFPVMAEALSAVLAEEHVRAST